MPLANHEQIVPGLNAAVDHAFYVAEKSGWHASFPERHDYRTVAVFQKAKLDWVGNKLMLVNSELCEAQDEIRNGHSFGAVYYSDSSGAVFPEQQHTADGFPTLKPEGFSVELADAVIRIFDLAGVVGIQNLGELVLEKIAFNRTRGALHGGKKF